MNPKQRAELVAKAHHLKPVIMIGQKGLTEAVTAETDLALTAHELIKVKIAGADKQERAEISNQLCAATAAELLSSVGNVAIIYRKNKDQG